MQPTSKKITNSTNESDKNPVQQQPRLQEGLQSQCKVRQSNLDLSNRFQLLLPLLDCYGVRTSVLNFDKWADRLPLQKKVFSSLCIMLWQMDLGLG